MKSIQVDAWRGPCQSEDLIRPTLLTTLVEHVRCIDEFSRNQLPVERVTRGPLVCSCEHLLRDRISHPEPF
jgi:hypothetical protein